MQAIHSKKTKSNAHLMLNEHKIAFNARFNAHLRLIVQLGETQCYH